MGKFLGGLALVLFMGVATFGPGALLGAIEWPFGAGPYTSEGQACIYANVVATQLNTMDQAGNAVQAKAQLEQAARSMDALAEVVTVEPQHGQFQRLASSTKASVSAMERGDLEATLSSAAAMQRDALVVNRWYASSCGSWTIRLPIWLNEVYAGGLPTFV